MNRSGCREMRSGLRRLPERVEISTRLFGGGAVKDGLALDRPQPVLMVANPADELILLHPGPDRLGRIHEKPSCARRRAKNPTMGALSSNLTFSIASTMRGGIGCRPISFTTVIRSALWAAGRRKGARRRTVGAFEAPGNQLRIY
jgi:hypothetical protein